MVRHFLILRNAVAAYSNPEAPADLLMTSDSVYEIQHFAEELFRMALGNLRSAMPNGAITRRRRTWPAGQGRMTQ